MNNFIPQVFNWFLTLDSCLIYEKVIPVTAFYAVVSFIPVCYRFCYFKTHSSFCLSICPSQKPLNGFPPNLEERYTYLIKIYDSLGFQPDPVKTVTMATIFIETFKFWDFMLLT